MEREGEESTLVRLRERVSDVDRKRHIGIESDNERVSDRR